MVEMGMWMVGFLDGIKEGERMRFAFVDPTYCYSWMIALKRREIWNRFYYEFYQIFLEKNKQNEQEIIQNGSRKACKLPPELNPPIPQFFLPPPFIFTHPFISPSHTGRPRYHPQRSKRKHPPPKIQLQIRKDSLWILPRKRSPLRITLCLQGRNPTLQNPRNRHRRCRRLRNDQSRTQPRRRPHAQSS